MHPLRRPLLVRRGYRFRRKQTDKISRQKQNTFDLHTASSVAQTVVLKPVILALPVLTPFRRFIITGLIFLMCFKLFDILLKGLQLSGRRNALIKLCRSRITAISTLGRRKSCRSLFLPWGVWAKWWKTPYNERPSLEEDDFFPGPWFNTLGWDSDWMICKVNNVVPLINLLNYIVSDTLRVLSQKPTRFLLN